MSQSYGVKISKDGKDSRRDPLSDMSFTSGEDTFRVINKGSVVVTIPVNEYQAYAPTIQAGVIARNAALPFGESFPTSTIYVLAFMDYGDGPCLMPFLGSLLTRFIGGTGYFYPMTAPFGAAIEFQAWRTSNTPDEFGGTFPAAYSVTIYYYLICVTANGGYTY